MARPGLCMYCGEGQNILSNSYRPGTKKLNEKNRSYPNSFGIRCNYKCLKRTAFYSTVGDDLNFEVNIENHSR